MTSASTLARRARAEKDPKKAKRLRQQAAKLRREARQSAAYAASKAAELRKSKRKAKPKKVPPRIANKGLHKDPKAEKDILMALSQSLNSALDTPENKRALDAAIAESVLTGQGGVRVMPDPGPAGWRLMSPRDLSNRMKERFPASDAVDATSKAMGLMQGNPTGTGAHLGETFEQFAERITKLARGKKPEDAEGLKSALTLFKAAQHYEGQMKAERSHGENIKRMIQRNRDAIVCGFVAEAESAMPLPPGDVLMLSGNTITKIVDALHEAGYTGKGRNRG